MIRALLIYVTAVTAALVAVTVASGVPYEWIAATAFVVVTVPSAAVGGAMIVRHMSRKARADWQHLGCDPVSRLPVTRVTAEPVYRIETTYGHCYSNQPPLQIEAPRREMTQWHNGD